MKTLLSATFSILLLSACTAHVNWEWSSDPIPSLDKETADLADVTTDAMELVSGNGVSL